MLMQACLIKLSVSHLKNEDMKIAEDYGEPEYFRVGKVLGNK